MPEIRETVTPALTAEEWARRFHSIQCYDSWSEEQSEKTGVGEISADLDYLGLTSHQHSEIANFSAPSDRHALAALALYRQPFGFTAEDVAALSRCADDAERLNAARMWDDEGHAAHERVRTIAKRIAALLPPAP